MKINLSKTTPRVLLPNDLFLITGERLRKTPHAFYEDEFGYWTISEPIEGLKNKVKIVCTHACGAMEFLVTNEPLDTKSCKEPNNLVHNEFAIINAHVFDTSDYLAKYAQVRDNKTSGNVCSCGGMLIRTGKCETCQSCGTTSGCG
jgi:hypothetical protein